MAKVEKIYETDSNQNYAVGGHGQVVSRTLHSVVERGDTPLDGGYGDVELAAPETSADESAPSQRIDLDFNTNTIAISPDAAAIGFAAMQDAVRGEPGFRLDYTAD